MQASGKFEIKLQPLVSYSKGADGISLGRMSIDKTFSGDLDATSKGEMLNAMTSVQGSAGYVAIEQVTGMLAEKSGSFVLQHYGKMSQGNNFLLLEVVPDSGAGELTDISGKMLIRIEEGQHFYEFDYSFDG